MFNHFKFMRGDFFLKKRDEDSELHRVVKSLDDLDARATTGAERAFLRGLGGGCTLPVGAHAWRESGQLKLLGFVGSNTGGLSLRGEVTGGDPEALGEKLAAQMLSEGARELL